MAGPWRSVYISRWNPSESSKGHGGNTWPLVHEAMLGAIATTVPLAITARGSIAYNT